MIRDDHSFPPRAAELRKQLESLADRASRTLVSDSGADRAMRETQPVRELLGSLSQPSLASQLAAGLGSALGTSSSAAAIHSGFCSSGSSLADLAGGVGSSTSAAATHKDLGIAGSSLADLASGIGSSSSAAAMYKDLGIASSSLADLAGGIGSYSSAAAMYKDLGMAGSSLADLAGSVGRSSSAAAMYKGLGFNTSASVALGEGFARNRLWADTLAPLSTGQIAEAIGHGVAIRSEVEKISQRAHELLTTAGHPARYVGEAMASSELFARTSMKMSVLAGSLDVLGVGTRTSDAAFQSLFGDWHTHRELPEEYWRNWSTRARMYRDADVDPGLIDSDAAEVVEALVESGVVEGAVSTSGTVTAVLKIGATTMRISARRPRSGAHEAISEFEGEIRDFISAKLAASNGEDWFKLRVPGDVLTRAKYRRQEALKGGEDWMPLIQYVDLGDLIPIVTRTDNWRDTFGAVFLNAVHFKVDLERLNVSRRPTTHTRKVDPVRLAEIMIVISRLLQLMNADGKIDAGWDDDR